MVVTPENIVESIADCGADSITFHLEATDKVQETIDKIKNKGCKVGLSVKPNTPIEAIYPYLDQLDMVLIMTVEPGKGGQAYMDAMTDKIIALRKEIGDRSISIQVDGGINASTITKAYQAGADNFVAGSAVFKGDIVENTKTLLKIVEE